jgi:hypothetical protein
MSGENLANVDVPLGVSASVSDLKKLIEKSIGCPCQLQTLVYGTDMLSNRDTTLDTVGIADGSTVLLVSDLTKYGVPEKLDIVPKNPPVGSSTAQVATVTNGLANALILKPMGQPELHGADDDDYNSDLDVVVTKTLQWRLRHEAINGPVEMRWFEIINGMGDGTQFRCFVPCGQPLSIFEGDSHGSGGPAFAYVSALANHNGADCIWVPVVWPAGPTQESNYCSGYGWPVNGFIKLEHLRPLPEDSWTLSEPIARPIARPIASVNGFIKPRRRLYS